MNGTDNQKFLGICIVISAVIIAGAICIHAHSNRYQLQFSNPPGVTYVFDTWTGELKSH
jgi:hypothetical protein